jgi:hypothetical protein
MACGVCAIIPHAPTIWLHMSRSPVAAMPRLVTTGLDPVVHADSHHARRCPMDCRIKSGNDG